MLSLAAGIRSKFSKRTANGVLVSIKSCVVVRPSASVVRLVRTFVTVWSYRTDHVLVLGILSLDAENCPYLDGKRFFPMCSDLLFSV